MKFNFKIQEYQTDAVNAVAEVFTGHKKQAKVSYIRDMGMLNAQDTQLSFVAAEDGLFVADSSDSTGYTNDEVGLTDERLLKNIRQNQT